MRSTDHVVCSRAAIAAAAVVVAMSLGCRPSPSSFVTGLEVLDGRVVSDAPVLVAPGRHLRPWPEIDGWMVRRSATVVVWVDERPAEPLGVTVTAASPAGDRSVWAKWNGEEIGSWVVGTGPTRLDVVVVPDQIGPGVHQLEIGAEPLPEPDAETVGPSAPRLAVSRVKWTVAGLDGEMTHDPATGSFLAIGVTGPADLRLGGCLFDGPQDSVHELSLSGPSEIGFVLRQLSRRPAEFVIAVDEVEHRFTVGRTEVRPVRIPIDRAGEHSLRLTVEGDEDGLFLWGAPHVAHLNREPPTVVVITLDTTRRDAVVGPDRTGVTPHLDALATRATRYDHAIATAPWTLPTHASIFTGLYPSRHGAGVTDVALHPDTVTLAEMVRDAGFFTAGFVGGSLASSEFGLAQGFLAFGEPPGMQRPGREITPWAVQAIETADQTPLLLFLNYFDPHAPYEAEPEFRARFDVDALARELPPGPVRDLAMGRGSAWARIHAEGEARTAAELAYLRAAYLAEVAAMDAEIGVVLDSMERAGRLDDALVVVVADHGEHLGERGRFTHSFSLDPEMVRVPMLVKWPGQRKAAVVTTPVSHVDVLPTVVDVLGLAPVPGLDGAPLPRSDRREALPRIVAAEEHAMLVHQRPSWAYLPDHAYAAATVDRHDILVRDDATCWSGDAGDWRQGACIRTPAELADEIEAILGPLTWAADDSAARDLDPDQAEALRALGYLE